MVISAPNGEVYIRTGDQRRLIVKNTDVKVANSLCDNDPHPLAALSHGAIFFVCFDIENELCRLSAVQCRPFLERRYRERSGYFV